MSSCTVCGTEGGATVRFVVAQKDGQDKIPIGLGECSVCFSCIRKKRHVSDYAIFILGFFLTASLLLLLFLMGGVEVFATIPVFVLIMIFLPLVTLFLLGRYEYNKVNRESAEKNLTEKEQAAAQKLAIQYFKKHQSVPAECVLLNFEPLAASGKFGNYLLEWHGAQSDLARLL